MTPFRFKAKAAAFFCGMSESSFRRAVASGDMPEGKRAPGGVYWFRADLEKAMLGKSESRDFRKAI